MTDDARDFDWPRTGPSPADLKALLNHHAADTLRAFALDLSVGQPDHALISLGEVRHAARVRAHRLDGAGRGCNYHLGGALDGLCCNNNDPHTPGHGCTFAASAGDHTKASEAIQ